MRHVDFVRLPAGPALDGIIEWFWSVSWEIPDGKIHHQQVLNHPAGNISVGTIDDDGVSLDPAEGRVYGVMTGLSHRPLTATGWTVAARTTVGGLGVILGFPAKDVVDTELRLDQSLPGLDGTQLVKAVRRAATNEARTVCLQRSLTEMVAEREQSQVDEAREVARIAAMAEHDRTVRRSEQLAEAGGVSVRTLQRLFDVHVGVSPSFVIRRWRIIEAAESALEALETGTKWKGWSTVAAELGYSDQAHLTRDFRKHLGTSPAAYLSQATTPAAPRES